MKKRGEEWRIENQNQKKKQTAEAKQVTRARKQISRELEEKYKAYFVFHKPWPKALAYDGSFILGGIGVDVLLEAWINKKRQRI
ncbi:hypothetical protein CARUB_v10015826mg [Capsella rubella]|uniref:Uncharacterized protein n=1 Tax=Capsella rubella TaxID=81985 RepID=R0GA40_9BRAS|nr:hypothetical protein CARUB_v10015826mg [Capsella rubella]